MVRGEADTWRVIREMRKAGSSPVSVVAELGNPSLASFQGRVLLAGDAGRRSAWVAPLVEKERGTIEGVVLGAGPVDVHGREHLHRVGIAGGGELVAGAVEQDPSQRRVLAVQAAGRPEAAHLLGVRGRARRPARAAVRRDATALAHN